MTSLVPAVVLAKNAYDGYKAGGADAAMYYAASTLVPYNFGTNKFDMGRAGGFYVSLVGTYAAKKLIAMSGVNKYMKGLPFRL